MSESSSSGPLGPLVDHLLTELEAKRSIDVPATAERFGLSEDEVSRCLDGLRAVHELGEAVSDDLDEAAAIPLMPAPEGYTLLGELGRGGMGIVFRARHEETGQVVALKVIRPHERTLGPALARFRQEAKALARLDHPGIVSIHEVGEVEDSLYFTMDLIEGESLDQCLARGKLPPEEALDIVTQVTEAMAYVHERGLVHRDLKPQNILLNGRGGVFITDFGLVRQLDEDRTELTRTGQILGTPNYMSPEQARGEAEAIGPTTDVWALGCVLYECLCGTPPFEGTNAAKVLQEVMHHEPVRPRRVDPRVTPAMQAVILKAMAKHRSDRYLNAGELREDLNALATGSPVRAQKDNDFLWLRQKLRRYRSEIVLFSVAVLLTFFLTSTWSPLAPGEAKLSAVEVVEALKSGEREEILHRAATAAFERDPGVREKVRDWIHATADLARLRSERGRFEEALALLREAKARLEEVEENPRRRSTGWADDFSSHKKAFAWRLAFEEGAAAARRRRTTKPSSALEAIQQADWLANSPENHAAIRRLANSDDPNLRIFCVRVLRAERHFARPSVQPILDDLSGIARTLEAFESRQSKRSHFVSTLGEDGLLANDASGEDARELAEDDSLHPNLRISAAYALSLIGDLHFHRLRPRPHRWDSPFAEACVAHWKKVRDLDYKNRRRGEIDAALQRLITDETPKCSRRTLRWIGVTARSSAPRDVQKAWQEVRDKDPVPAWLARAGLPATATKEQILAHWQADQNAKGAFQLGCVLTALYGTDHPRPLSPDNRGAWLRTARKDLGTPEAIRAGLFLSRKLKFPNEARRNWYVRVPRPQELRALGAVLPAPPNPLDLTETILLPKEDAPRSALHPLLVASRDTPPSVRAGHKFLIGTKIKPRGPGKVLQTQIRVDTRIPLGGAVDLSLGSESSPGIVNCSVQLFDHPRFAHPEIALVLSLASLDATGSEKAWTLDDWRAATRQSLATIKQELRRAAEEKPFQYPHRQYWNILSVMRAIALLGMDDLSEELQGFGELLPPVRMNDYRATDPLETALAFFGDATAIKEFEPGPLDRRPSQRASAERFLGLDNAVHFWTFVQQNSPSDHARQWAKESLRARARRSSKKPLPRVMRLAELRADSPPRRFSNFGNEPLPPKRDSMTLMVALAFALVVLLLGASAVDAFRRERLGQHAPRLVLILGLAFVSTTLICGGINLVPQTLGWLMIIGASITMAMRVMPGALLSASGALIGLALEFMPASEASWFPYLALAAQALTVLGVTTMANSLGQPDFRERTWLGAFPLGLWLLLTLSIAAGSLLARLLGFPVSLKDNALITLAYLSLYLIWILRRGTRGKGRLPWGTVLFFVLPLLSVLTGLLLHVVSSDEELPALSRWSGLTGSIGVAAFIILFISSLQLLNPPRPKRA